MRDAEVTTRTSRTSRGSNSAATEGHNNDDQMFSSCISNFPRNSLSGVIHVRQDDSIAVGVLEGLAAPVPVWIEARHGCETALLHPGDAGIVLVLLRQIKDDQVVLCRRPPSDVTGGDGKF